MRVPAGAVCLFTWLGLGCEGATSVPDESTPSPSSLVREESPGGDAEFSPGGGRFGRARRVTDLVQTPTPSPDPGWPRPSHLVDFRGEVYFAVNYYTGDPEGELWASDGTARHTRRIQSFPPSAGVFNGISKARVIRDKLYLTINHTEMYGEAWASDGTTAGTVRLMDYPTPFGNSITPVIPIRNRLYFLRALLPSPYDPGPTELWSTDGTLAGTRPVFTLSNETYGPATSCEASAGDWIFFGLILGETGNEPWVSDGTPEGTRMLKDIRPGPLGSVPCSGGGPMAVGDEVYFTASRTGEPELWTTNGTEAGTRKVMDAPVTLLHQTKDHLYVLQRQSVGLTLWKLRIRKGPDGAPELAATIPNAPGARYPPSLMSSLMVDGRLYLMLLVNGAEEGEPNGQLWVTDGSNPGTRLLHDKVTVRQNSAPLIERYDMLGIGNHVLFGCHTQDRGRELCVTDGSIRGTGLLQEIEPGSASSSPHAFICAGRNIYFVAHDEEHGYELWKLKPHPGLHPSTSCVTSPQGQQ